jgi:hypothetical protein
VTTHKGGTKSYSTSPTPHSTRFNQFEASPIAVVAGTTVGTDHPSSVTIIASLVIILIVVPAIIIPIVMAVVAVAIVMTTVIIGRCWPGY